MWANTQLWFARTWAYKGCHHLTAAETTVCTLADTYYIVDWTRSDWTCNNWFTFDWAGKLTYNWESWVIFLFTWVSDLSVSAASRVTYWLYINWALVSWAETPTDFTSASKVGNISITNFIPLNPWDYIEIYCKNDVAWTTITHNTLLLTLLWDR